MAPSEQPALDRFAEFSDKWEKRYSAIIRLWTNAIESVNARIRRAIRARGHFPTEATALKCVYLAIMSLDLNGTARQRWSNRWKAARNAVKITFDGRLSAGRK